MSETKKSPEKAQGLRLTLGGAPNTPHTIVGIPGVYRPGDPVPVGGPGELSEDGAKGLHENAAVPLELVSVPAKDLDRLREQAEEDRANARGGLARTARDRRVKERARAEAQEPSINEKGGE